MRTPFLPLVLTLACANVTLAQTAYHDQSLGFHLGRYIALRSSGHRLVSLDVAGDLSHQRWSAVWEQRPGATWEGAFGMNAWDFLRWRQDHLSQGYRDEWITASGSGLQRVYGGVMVMDGLDAQSYTDISESSLVSLANTWGDAGYLLHSLNVHDLNGSPRYSAVFVENPRGVRWGYRFGDTASEYQATFDAFVNTCGARPGMVAASASQRYASVFRDDHIGEWTARHGLSKSAYESEAALLANTGWEPYQITVSGTGSAARYAAIFRRGSPAPSQVTITGQRVLAFDAIDEYFVGVPRRPGFLQEKNARAAGVAITKNGRLVFARAYSRGPNGIEIIQPTTGFRLASLSKSIATIATYHRIQRDRTYTEDSRLVHSVNLGTPADARVNDIRIHHLIDHRSGYTGTWPLDVTEKLAYARQTIQNDPLSYAPGAQEQYSNGAYQLLTVALESKTGTPYWNYVRDQLMSPLSIQRAHLITSAPIVGDAFCIEARWGTARQLAISNNFALPGQPLMNHAYAIRATSSDGSGGLVMSPVDYVRLISGVFDPTLATNVLSPATRALMEQRIQTSGRTGGWDSARPRIVNGQTIKAYEKGGLWRSAHTYGVWRTDGVAIAAFCTSPNAPSIDTIQDIVDQVANAEAWPQHDLFPTYGLPEFPRRTPGGMTTFGHGCGGGGRLPPHHDGGGLPEIGFTQEFELSGAPPLGSAYLHVGVARRSWNGIALPLDLGPFGAPGCELYTGPIATLTTRIDASGRATLRATYPQDPILLGARFYSQYVMLDPSANALGLAYSNALQTVLGE